VKEMNMELFELNLSNKLFYMFTMISNGNNNFKAELRGDSDYFDQLLKCVKMMIENLSKRTLHISYVEERVNELLDVVVKIRTGDFNVIVKKLRKMIY
jgi:hypothetical protein